MAFLILRILELFAHEVCKFLKKLKQNGISGKLLRLIKNFLSDRKQRVVLSQQSTSGIGRVSPRLYTWIFIFLYINDLVDILTSNQKLFADDTLFSTVTDLNASANQINNDLHNISPWAYQWKISFNRDTSKQAQEVIFSHKRVVTTHPELAFNNNPVHETATQKHLGMFLDFKLNFQEHFENMLNKVNKTIGLLRKL